MAASFNMTPESAAELIVSHGSYPGAIPYLKDSARWSAYVRDAILEPAIGRDILALAPVRKPTLLRDASGNCGHGDRVRAIKLEAAPRYHMTLGPCRARQRSDSNGP